MSEKPDVVIDVRGAHREEMLLMIREMLVNKGFTVAGVDAEAQRTIQEAAAGHRHKIYYGTPIEKRGPAFRVGLMLTRERYGI